MQVAGGVSEGNPRKEEWHAFGGAAVRCAREEEQVISDMLVGVPRPPMSSQGEGQEGDGDCAHPLRRVVPQDAVAIVKDATAVMRAAERHLHLCVCRACRCREEVQATSHHWAAEAVFPLRSAGEATLLARDVLFCIDVPNGVSRRRVVAVQLSCPSLHTWLPVAWLICSVTACSTPLGGCSHVFFYYAVERCWGVMAAGILILWFALSGDGVYCRCFLPISLFSITHEEGKQALIATVKL
ncbi:hypothetical protein TCDM_11521 [Trypanosoma cruzi Dm28c]|uniref:Uncharacterized protein n=1 Tax=Trypanosoma cruzi Dm28c TaxID=1416333 RepID=V5B072_TRYCR|nr:hypothetical protein TCDM_11521 [Trypanosoma cruzi Dm28c]